MREEAQLWWLEANDFHAAALANVESGQYFMAAFVCQQALETALKALWIVRRRELAPKKRNLVELAGGLDLPPALESHLMVINPAYMNTRYHDAANGLLSRNYDRTIAEDFIRRTGEVLAWVQSRLEPE